MRENFRLELIRKILHAAGGVLIVLLFESNLLTLGVFGLLIVLYAAIVLYNFKYEKEIITSVLAINRADSRIPGLDILFFLGGCWLTLALFPQHIAFAAIMILAFADPVAHLVSRSFGATQTFLSRTTYVEGTIAASVAGTLAGWVYVPFFAALIASVIAMLIEAGELRIGDHHVDDDLLIPLVAGIVLWVISLAFPF